MGASLTRYESTGKVGFFTKILTALSSSQDYSERVRNAKADIRSDMKNLDNVRSEIASIMFDMAGNSLNTSELNDFVTSTTPSMNKHQNYAQKSAPVGTASTTALSENMYIWSVTDLVPISRKLADKIDEAKKIVNQIKMKQAKYEREIADFPMDWDAALVKTGSSLDALQKRKEINDIYQLAYLIQNIIKNQANSGDRRIQDERTKGFTLTLKKSQYTFLLRDNGKPYLFLLKNDAEPLVAAGSKAGVPEMYNEHNVDVTVNLLQKAMDNQGISTKPGEAMTSEMQDLKNTVDYLGAHAREAGLYTSGPNENINNSGSSLDILKDPALSAATVLFSPKFYNDIMALPQSERDAEMAKLLAKSESNSALAKKANELEMLMDLYPGLKICEK